MVIQISVIGFAPGFVCPKILQDTHQDAPTTSHSSQADDPRTPSPQYPPLFDPQPFGFVQPPGPGHESA